MTIVRIARESEKDTLHRIDQFYLYEFSKFMPAYYKLDGDGIFQDGNYLEYWADENKFPYLIFEGDELAGFALVKQDDGHFNLDQIFVMLKFQGTGTANRAATEIFNSHDGTWKLHSLKTNTKSEGFWPRVVTSFTSNQFEKESIAPKHTHYVYTFQNAP